MFVQKPPSEQSKEGRDHLAMKYQYSTSTQKYESYDCKLMSMTYKTDETILIKLTIQLLPKKLFKLFFVYFYSSNGFL